MLKREITRRESIKKIAMISGGLALYGAGGWSPAHSAPARAGSGREAFLVEGVGQAEEYNIGSLTKKVFDAAGGMSRFISKGDVVVIKPNVSWARRPDLAATTNPALLEAVIRLCQEAGAKKVRIVDHTIHDARRCFALTGVGKVAQNTGVDLVFPRSSMMKDMKINGHRLDVWPVFVPMVEADKVINLPIAKDHVLSTLTLGMKNWIGGVGGRRHALHQDIHQTVVDLSQFFQPTVTLVDALRIMVKNGPSGGSPSDVVAKNTLILSNDQVAADARAARLFEYDPDRIGFIQLAQKWGLGLYDDQVGIKRVAL